MRMDARQDDLLSRGLGLLLGVAQGEEAEADGGLRLIAGGAGGAANGRALDGSGIDDGGVDRGGEVGRRGGGGQREEEGRAARTEGAHVGGGGRHVDVWWCGGVFGCGEESRKGERKLVVELVVERCL